jgi:hypothetical protein
MGSNIRQAVCSGTTSDTEALRAKAGGGIENTHCTAVESFSHPPRVHMSVCPQGKSCSTSVRLLVIYDPPAHGGESCSDFGSSACSERPPCPVLELLPVEEECEDLRGKMQAVAAGPTRCWGGTTSSHLRF